MFSWPWLPRLSRCDLTVERLRDHHRQAVYETVLAFLFFISGENVRVTCLSIDGKKRYCTEANMLSSYWILCLMIFRLVIVSGTSITIVCLDHLEIASFVLHPTYLLK